MTRSTTLVQHCQSQHHVNDNAHSWPDSANGLTELGQRQATCVASRLQQEVGDTSCQIYSSDMRRALETAQIIGKALGTDPVAVPELREWNGHLAIAGQAEAPNARRNSGDWSMFNWRPSPQAETWREFHARVSNYMDGLVSSHSQELPPVLVVHGGTLSNIAAWWLRLELDTLSERTPFAASPGSISVLKTNQHDNRVIGTLNDRAHLYLAGLLEFGAAT